MIFFDNRWSGNNGIGRYSKEMSLVANIVRIKFINGAHPTKLLELFKPIFHRKKIDIYYSPGYIARPFFNSQIITIHDLILIESSIGNVFHKIYFNFYLKSRVKSGKIRVVTVSEHSRRKIAEWANLPPNRISVIPNGISEDILSAGVNLSPKPRGKTLMFLGSMKPHKRFDLFVQSINLLVDSYSIILVGPDLEAERIDKRHFVTHLRDVNDIDLARAYLESNIVIVTSHFEGFCMPVLEGSYLGCKILHLGVLPTIEEIIGESSFSTFGSTNPADISREIEFAVNSKPQLSEQDRRNLAKKFNWDYSRNKLKNILLIEQEKR